MGGNTSTTIKFKDGGIDFRIQSFEKIKDGYILVAIPAFNMMIKATSENDKNEKVNAFMKSMCEYYDVQSSWDKFILNLHGAGFRFTSGGHRTQLFKFIKAKGELKGNMRRSPEDGDMIEKGYSESSVSSSYKKIAA